MSGVAPVDPNRPPTDPYISKDEISKETEIPPKSIENGQNILSNLNRAPVEQIPRAKIKPATKTQDSQSPDRKIAVDSTLDTIKTKIARKKEESDVSKMTQVIDVKKEREEFWKKVRNFIQPDADNVLLPNDPRVSSTKEVISLYEEIPTDIYFYGGLVLKPGQHEIRMALLVDRVASELGMSEVVPAATEMSVSHIVASKDYDWAKGEMRTYDIDESDNLVTLGVESDLESEEELDPIEDEGDNTFAWRHNSRFQLKISGSHDQLLEVVGQGVKCMVQQCFNEERLFTGNGDKVLKLGGVDEKESPQIEKDAFYQRINFRTFFNAFMIVTLFNPEDAKVSNLKDSNVLFEEIDHAALAVRLIDTAEFGSDRPVPRNGLMGFPQAREVVSGESREYILKKLLEIAEKKGILSELFSLSLDENFEKNSLEEERNEKHLKDFERRIDAIATYAHNPPAELTLETLFFAVYPEYQKLWELFSREGRDSPEYRAALLGFATKQSELERYI